MMRTFKTEAIIIKRRDVGEADRLITVFTRDHGKLSVKAKGIRRVPSRRSAHVELLNTAVLTLHGVSRYPILTEATASQTFENIKTDLQKVGFAYHICELIDGLCPENEEHRNIYNLLKITLGKLSSCSASLPENLLLPIVHDFEVELLTILGYWHRPLAMSQNIDLASFIEGILERKLKSKRVFQRI